MSYLILPCRVIVGVSLLVLCVAHTAHVILQSLLQSLASTVTLSDTTHPLGVSTVDYMDPPCGCNTSRANNNCVDTVLNLAILMTQRVKKLQSENQSSHTATSSVKDIENSLQSLLMSVQTSGVRAGVAGGLTSVSSRNPNRVTRLAALLSNSNITTTAQTNAETAQQANESVLGLTRQFIVKQ